MNDLTKFVYNNQPVRTLVIDGEPWFVGKDVCDVLGIRNSRDAFGRLDSDERNTVGITDGTPGNPNRVVVNEPGLYALIFTSRTSEAQRFKRWVTHEVLPQIRKTGTYQAPAEDEQTVVARAFQITHKQLEQTKAALEAAQPAVEYVEKYVTDSDLVTIRDWAEQYGLSRGEAFQLLQDAQIVFKKHIETRWSNSKNQKVEETEYRAHARYLDHFSLRPHHKVPRYYNGQVRQTLYVKQGMAVSLARKAGILAAHKEIA